MGGSRCLLIGANGAGKSTLLRILGGKHLTKPDEAVKVLNKDAFRDVVVGTDKINRQGIPERYGFDATKGWDPVTGHGTPQFQKLLAAALAQ